MVSKPRGRKKKYSEYEDLVKSLPKVMKKRAKYVNGIGVFRGARGETVFIKIRLPKGANFKDKNYEPGASLEIKLGNLSSFTWQQLEAVHDEMQGKADRGEALEDTPAMLFSDWSNDWLKLAKVRLKGYDTAKIHVNGQFDPAFGKKSLSDITVTDINAWITNRLSEVTQ